MTKEQQNIALYKFLGYQPVKSWRFYYDKDKNVSYRSISSKKGALETIEILKKTWPYNEYPQDYEFSEPEEYDDWFYGPQVTLDFIYKVEENLPIESRREYYKRLRSSPVEFSEHSSIEIRREALLKTLNLWEE